MRSLLLLLLACDAPSEGVEVPRGCNGDPDLCDRSLLEITLLRTHNSHASEERDYSPLSWNHYAAIPTQLDDGVRSLNIDVYPPDPDEPGTGLRSCHGFCSLGSQPFAEALAEVETFLSLHPTAFVHLDFQLEAPIEDVADAVEASGLSARATVHDPDAGWPSLQQMLERGEQILIAGGGGLSDRPWFHARDAVVRSTPWSYEHVDELDCRLDGSLEEGLLFQMVHVITDPIADPERAREANQPEVLRGRIEDCLPEWGRPPNLVSVDFYEEGDPASVVDELNAP